MVDEQVDVTVDQTVAGQGEEDQVASGQDVTQVVTETGEEGQPATGQPQDQRVPYARLKEVIDEKNNLQAALQQAQARQAQYEGQLASILASQTRAAPSAPSVDEDPLGLATIGDSDVVEGAQVKKLVATLHKTYNQRLAGLEQTLEQRMFLAANPDYAQLVGTVDPTTGVFIPTPLMKEIASEIQTQDPGLFQMLLTHPSGKSIALRLARERAKLVKPAVPTNKGPNAGEASAKAKTDVMSPLAVGGGSPTPTGAQGLLSDQELARVNAWIDQNG